MKQTITFLLLTITVYINIYSQEIPSPDYSSRPYILKPNNTLENFERADANSDMKVKGLGYGGVEMYFAAFGTTSTARFNPGTLPRIIIRLENNVDPEESITLSKADIKKDRRRFLMGSRSMTGTARNTDQVEIKLRFKKIREGIHEIVLPTDLPPGEYAFMPMGDQAVSITSVTNIKISCFGINGQDGLPVSSEPTGAPVPATSSSTATLNSTSAITPQPDFDNAVYYLNQADNTLIDLERAVNAKSEGTFGFLNMNSAVSIKGVSSPVIVSTAAQGFIVRLANGVDPYTIIELMPCNTNTEKQTRDYSPVAKKNTPAQSSIPLKIKRIEANTYMLLPLQPLSHGEYFFLNKALKEKSVFAFKVD